MTISDLAPRLALKELIDRPGAVLAPGVAHPLYARLAERAGFELVFVTGAGIANTLYGYPDLGLLSMAEVVEATRRIVDGVTVPVFADADTGYGNHLNVTRAVKDFERAGVAGLFIEDQVAPKKCGHFSGKQVIPVGEMVEKIVAARLARQDPNLVLMARTDAIQIEGFEATIERARAYVAAGAELIFVEGPETIEQLRRIPDAIGVPCVVNMVDGGVTPIVPLQDLTDFGFKFVIYANVALRAAATSVERAFDLLLADGISTRVLPDMMTWQHRQAVAGLQDWEQLDSQIHEAGERIIEATEQSAVGDVI